MLATGADSLARLWLFQLDDPVTEVTELTRRPVCFTVIRAD